MEWAAFQAPAAQSRTHCSRCSIPRQQPQCDVMLAVKRRNTWHTTWESEVVLPKIARPPPPHAEQFLHLQRSALPPFDHCHLHSLFIPLIAQKTGCALSRDPTSKLYHIRGSAEDSDVWLEMPDPQICVVSHVFPFFGTHSCLDAVYATCWRNFLKLN